MVKIDFNQLIEQAKALVVNREEVWDDIASAEYDLMAIFFPWVFVLGAIQGLFVFLGWVIAYPGGFLGHLFAHLIGGIIKVVGTVFVTGFLANLVAEKFEGQPDITQAMRLAAFAYMPVAAAHVFFILFSVVGFFSWLTWFIGFGGFFYFMFLGCGPTMALPDDVSKKVMFVAISSAPFWLAGLPFSSYPVG